MYMFINVNEPVSKVRPQPVTDISTMIVSLALYVETICLYQMVKKALKR